MFPYLLLLTFIFTGCAAAETVLHHERSADWDVWVVEAETGVRYLRFSRAGINQSAVIPGHPERLIFPYTQAAIAGVALRPAAQRWLMVGLGGGSLPMFLRHYRPDAEIDVVEIDAVVVKVATGLLGFSADRALRVHVADGRRWLFAAPKQRRWDVVVLDAYGKDAIVMPLATVEFIRRVGEHLNEDGLVISNVWSERYNPHYRDMLRTFQSVFADVAVIRARDSDSRIILASPTEGGLARQGVVAAARALTADWNLEWALGDIVIDGYVGAAELPPGGRPLTDRTIDGVRVIRQ